MTNESGEVVFDQDYLPFGGDLAVVGDLEPKNDVSEGYKYTGQREEVSIGLYYYGARFYDPELGRFITEDTYVGEIVDSQSQNIYIYTMNNPMKYVDPTGRFSEEYDEDYGYFTGRTVEQGDTLTDIALDIYGNESAVEALANMNDIGDIDKIYEGQRLMLPGVAIDSSGNGYIQSGFVEGVREVSDAYIAATIVGTVALEAGGLEALYTAGSSAYTAADKAFEKGYYWASDKLGRFSNFLSNKIKSFFGRGSANSQWYNADGSINYPPNNGAVPGSEVNITLQPGKILGRYGEIRSTSNFATQAGASPDKLSLPPNTDPTIYTELRVVKPILNTVQAEIAKWGGTSGGGLQYELPMTIKELVHKGYIVPK